jgi:hypothetical protein
MVETALIMESILGLDIVELRNMVSIVENFSLTGAS